MALIRRSVQWHGSARQRVRRGSRAAMIGGGRDCTFENNIFVDCTPATHVDSRGGGRPTASTASGTA